MTCVNELNQCECEKLDPLFIDAYVKHYLDPTNDTRLILESSWGESSVDLTPAVKAAETITHLFLTPENKPTALQYNREDYGREGAEDDGIDCIEGDALSRIISMRYLKDVDQNRYPTNGDIYMYDSTTNLFYTFNLQGYMDRTDSRLNNLEGRVNDLEQDLANAWNQINILDGRVKSIQNQVFDLQNRVTSLEQKVDALQTQLNNYISKTDQRLANIEAVIAKPSWAPASSRLVWGTINDMYNLNPNEKGLYSHNPANPINGDQQFA